MYPLYQQMGNRDSADTIQRFGGKLYCAMKLMDMKHIQNKVAHFYGPQCIPGNNNISM